MRMQSSSRIRALVRRTQPRGSGDPGPISIPSQPMDNIELARRAHDYWSRVASENHWTVRSLTIWVQHDEYRDSVGVRDGERSVYFVDYATDEVTAELSFDDW